MSSNTTGLQNLGVLAPDAAAPRLDAPHAHPEPVVNAADAARFARSVAEHFAGGARPVWIAAPQRAVEIVIALIALALTLPILLLMVLAVRVDSRGRAVFRQRRIGKDLKPFTLYKMRTLFVDARQRFPELYKYQFSPTEIGTLKLSDLKAPNDPRVTRLGRFLRQSSLDEIPNFLNLLKGDIALVGPRPELYECLKYYEDIQLLKFAVKPGLTGLAQVRGRNSNSFQEMIRWDIHYVQNRSVGLDLSIAIQTVGAVLSRRGAW